MITDVDHLVKELLARNKEQFKNLGVYVYNSETGHRHEIIDIKFVEDKDGDDSCNIIIDPEPFIY